jgi:hypothetical protein
LLRQPLLDFGEIVGLGVARVSEGLGRQPGE